jgi:hypothetical protein
LKEYSVKGIHLRAVSTFNVDLRPGCLTGGGSACDSFLFVNALEKR